MLRIENFEVKNLVVCVDSNGQRCEVYPIPDEPDDGGLEDFLDDLKQTDATVWVCKHQLINVYAAEDKEEKW